MRITSDSNSSSSFVVDGHTDVHGTLVGAGHLNQDNTTFVTIKNGGSLIVDDSIDVASPSAIGDFTISGRFSMEAGSTAQMQIGAGTNVFSVPPTADSAAYDQVQGITVSGGAGPVFNGTINVTNTGSMDTSSYQVGMAFDLFNWDNEATVDATGNPTLALPSLPTGLELVHRSLPHWRHISRCPRLPLELRSTRCWFNLQSGNYHRDPRAIVSITY